MGVLTEAAPRSQRPALVSYFMPAAQRKFNADVKIMRDICQLLIDQRKAHPTDKKDLLNAMIKGRDPKTGEAMSDDLIMNNMATLMIAGKYQQSLFCILANISKAMRRLLACCLSFSIISSRMPMHTRKLEQKSTTLLGQVQLLLMKSPNLYSFKQQCEKRSACVRPSAFFRCK